MVFGLCLVGVALLVLLGYCLFCLPLFFVSAWWNRGIAEEVTMASYSKAVTGTAVMARSANEEKKTTFFYVCFCINLHACCLGFLVQLSGFSVFLMRVSQNCLFSLFLNQLLAFSFTTCWLDFDFHLLWIPVSRNPFFKHVLV